MIFILPIIPDLGGYLFSVYNLFLVYVIYYFSNKTIILFATSGGSRFGSAIENLKNSVSASTKIVEGKILNTNPTVEELAQWVNSL